MYKQALFILYIFSLVFNTFCQSVVDLSYYNATYRSNGSFSTTRTARKLSAPVTVNGYLMVYNEDLGYFNQHPNAVIEQLNTQKKFGRDNWRIPTPSELSIMENNANILGMGSDIYMCTTHANGQLRLVSTEGAYSNAVHIGDTYWSKSNFGTTIASERGRPLTYQEAVEKIPDGYRLPTEEEVLSLIHSGVVRFGNLTSGQSLFIPFTESKTVDWSTSSCYYQWGEYWIQGGKTLYFGYNVKEYGFNQSERTNEQPQIQSPSSTQCYVRYVLDK